jgi:hypothetical protein
MTRSPRPLARFAPPLLGLAAISAVSACSPYSLTEAKTPPVEAFGPVPRTDVATVCVIRPSHWAIAVTFVVHDNDQLVGATRAESYFCYLAAPGHHDLVSATGDAIDGGAGHESLTAQPGRRYWLHQDFDNVFGIVTDKLEWIDEARAREMWVECDCEYKRITGAPGGEPLPAALPLVSAR